MLKRAFQYLKSHWRGEQGLAWSFWINLVALRAVIHGAQEWLRPAARTDYSTIALPVLGLAILFHLVLFIWQAVGVIRAGEAHLRDTGSQAGNWGALLGLVAAFWLAASAGLEAFQMTRLPASNGRDFADRMERERASRYSLTISEDGTRLDFSGTIELGATRTLLRTFEQNPGIRLVVLQSDGGNIYEARGISRLIRERGLATRVETACSSACTTAFIGGIHRSLAPGARLGFHQYRVEEDGRQIILANPQAEQERDRELYRSAGVASEFIERMFEKKSNELWFPGQSELISASVVQEIGKAD